METAGMAEASDAGESRGGDADQAGPIAAAGSDYAPDALQGGQEFQGELVSVAGVLARFNPDTGEFDDEPVKVTGPQQRT